MMHDHKYGGGGRREVSRQLDEMGNDFKKFFGFGDADEIVKKALTDEKSDSSEKK